MALSARLIMALDYEHNPKIERETYSFMEGDQWFITTRGPYSMKLHEVDMSLLTDAGLAWLRRCEKKEESGGDRGPVGAGPGESQGDAEGHAR